MKFSKNDNFKILSSAPLIFQYLPYSSHSKTLACYFFSKFQCKGQISSLVLPMMNTNLKGENQNKLKGQKEFEKKNKTNKIF